MKRILLIDANLLLFRSFYAAYAINQSSQNMTTHLFFTSFLELFISEKPDYVFFAFDAHGPSKRQEEFPEYKAGRKKAPIEIFQQKNIITKILETMNLKWFEKVGDEADDLIATLTNKYKYENEILIFSEDKDLLQLVDNNVQIIIKNRNKNDNAKYMKINSQNFYNIFNYHPFQVIDYKGIAGDNSDNLSGIKGIGNKQAIALLEQYKNLENIYANLDHLKPRQKELFLNNKDQAMMCKRLATLNSDVDININIEELKASVENMTSNQVKNILEENQLKRILNLINKLMGL